MLLASQLFKTTIKSEGLIENSLILFRHDIITKKIVMWFIYFLNSSTVLGVTPFLSFMGRVTDSDEVPKP